jgi:hypothetical protein
MASDEGQQAWTTFLNDVLSVNGNGHTKLPAEGMGVSRNTDVWEIFFESRGLDVIDLRGSDPLPTWLAGRLRQPEGATFDDFARHVMLHGIEVELHFAHANYEDDEEE